MHKVGPILAGRWGVSTSGSPSDYCDVDSEGKPGKQREGASCQGWGPECGTVQPGGLNRGSKGQRPEPRGGASGCGWLGGRPGAWSPRLAAAAAMPRQAAPVSTQSRRAGARRAEDGCKPLACARLAGRPSLEVLAPKPALPREGRVVSTGCVARALQVAHHASSLVFASVPGGAEGGGGSGAGRCGEEAPSYAGGRGVCVVAGRNMGCRPQTWDEAAWPGHPQAGHHLTAPAPPAQLDGGASGCGAPDPACACGPLVPRAALESAAPPRTRACVRERARASLRTWLRQAYSGISCTGQLARHQTRRPAARGVGVESEWGGSHREQVGGFCGARIWLFAFPHAAFLVPARRPCALRADPPLHSAPK